jgi:dCTP deaminase
MGSEYYCTSDATRPIWKSAKKKILKEREPFIIPPGQFGFLLTKETIRVPSNTMAFISIRASIKFQGLINVSGFHVDPGYEGRLVFAVYNAGSAAVHLEEGMDIFLIWYADLDDHSQKKRNDGDDKTISNDLIKGMTKEVLSLHSLSKEIADVRFQMKFQWWVFGVAAFILLGVAIATFNFVFQRGLQTAFPPALTQVGGAPPPNTPAPGAPQPTP